MDCARRHSIAIARLYHLDLYQTGMMQALPIGQNFQLAACVDGALSFYGNLSRNRSSGTHVAIVAAFSLFLLRLCFVPESLALDFLPSFNRSSATKR